MTNFNNYNLNDAFIRQADRLSKSTEVSQNQKSQKAVSDGESFQEILDKQVTSKISFSKHAAYRTEQRSIEIGQSELDKLGSACEKASEKGIKDALIVMKNSAFIVNTPNKVVVTVVDKDSMADNVFTNIDGALFI
ncbi:MAG: flagellar protein [Clostridia bacterium]|nr:flagellar protein [Clostridia bacterium]